MKYLLLLSICMAWIVLTGCRTEDDTKGMSAVCAVHHVQMVRTTVPIQYGLLRPDARFEARQAASKSGFPNADTWVEGGCCSGTGSAQKAIIYTCPMCLEAARAWDFNYAKTNAPLSAK